MKYLRLIFILVPFAVVGQLQAQELDSDHDGVPDAKDKCPDTAQLKMLPADFKFAAAVNPERLGPGPKAYPVDASGCEPDTDGDGVIDSQDYCPKNSKEQLSKGVASNGCPAQSDFDGTPDYRDNCPGTQRHQPTDRYGCPKTADG